MSRIRLDSCDNSPKVTASIPMETPDWLGEVYLKGGSSGSKKLHPEERENGRLYVPAAAAVSGAALPLRMIRVYSPLPVFSCWPPAGQAPCVALPEKCMSSHL